MDDPNYPRATVREIDGKLVLDDPDALAVMRAVAKHNCRNTYEAQGERVLHFQARAVQLGKTPADVVIVLINVDDPHGRLMADALMPGHDWQAYRDRGEVPFARGLAGREGVQNMLRIFDAEAADKLSGYDATAVAVVVVDYGVAEVY